MENITNPARRNLLRGRIAKSTIEPKIRLPWIKSESTFVDKCTQCEACITSCESKIILKDEFGYPKVDFYKGECTFCQKCVESCEQPLFINRQDFDQKAAWPTTISIANSCLATNSIYCQSCRDECETSAITFKYVDSSIPVPNIEMNDCTLCGACVSKCPQSSIKISIIEEKVNG